MKTVFATLGLIAALGAATAHAQGAVQPEVVAVLRTGNAVAPVVVVEIPPAGLPALRVAAERDAQQQRAIAQGWAQGHYSPDQVARLESTQAGLAALQVQLSATGHETVDQALQMSHLRNLQDWAIASARPGL